MTDMSDLPCDCETTPLERLRYFNRQLLTADDMATEQEYFREKMRRHNRYLHGWGVVCGCAVEQVQEAKNWTVRVCPGYVVSPQGDDIHIDRCIDVDLTLGALNPPCTVRPACPPQGDMPGSDERFRRAYIAVRYAECFSRPVKVHPAGCGCDETSCEYSRVRESFEIKVLWSLPDSHKPKLTGTVSVNPSNDSTVGTTVGTTDRLPDRAIIPCPECISDPWVVLATVLLPTGQDTPNPNGGTSLNITYAFRHTLWPVQYLQTVVQNMAP